MVNGFAEGAEFLGIEISPNDKYFEYVDAILRPIYEENRAARTKDAMFNTEFVPAENLGRHYAPMISDNYSKLF